MRLEIREEFWSNVPSLWFTKMKIGEKIKNRFRKAPEEIVEEKWRIEDREDEKDVTEECPQTDAVEIIPEQSAADKEEKHPRVISLEEAIMWSEILGEPLSKKRRRKRMEQRYGNQGYVNRG